MSQEAILGAIRRGLGRGGLTEDRLAVPRARLAAPPRGPVPARGDLPRAAQVALFLRAAEREFASTVRVPALSAVPGAIAAWLAAGGLGTELVVAPHPELAGLAWGEAGLSARFGPACAADRVSVQHAFAGVAETGTLVLPSGPERPATLNLLPETEIVVLPASRVVGAYETVWDWLRVERGRGEGLTALHDDGGGFMPRALMLVSGVSRSADIEQTLELGAHGPRRLHVILVDDDPAACAAA